MKVACIVPISALDLVTSHTYHLVLAHIASVSSSYLDFYARQSQLFSQSKVVILDNSAHELGRPLEGGVLRRLNLAIKPSIFVVPDSLWDARENFELARKFEEEAKELQEENRGLEFMAVPHGMNKEEVLGNLRDLLSLAYVKYTGLSKTSARLGLRKELAREANREGKKIHFLGVWGNPIKEVLEGKELEKEGLGIMGLDTKYPAKLGVIGRSLLEYFPTPPNLDFTIEEKDFSKEWLKRQIEAFVWLAESNCSSEEELEKEFENGRF